MASVPSNWKDKGNGVYSTNMPGGPADDPFVLESKLDGSQELKTTSGKVVATRSAGQKDFQVKDNSLWSKVDDNTKSTISTSATNETYKLVKSAGTESQKTAIESQGQYKSKANSLNEQIASDQGYTATDSQETTGVSYFFPKELKYNGRLQYPLEMSDSQDKIRFTAVEIEKAAFNSPALSAQGFQDFKSPDVSYKKVDEPVYLAIQGPISDTNTAQWGEGKLSAIDAYVFKKSRDAMEGKGSVGDVVDEIYNAVKEGAPELKDYLAGQAASIPDILSRTKTKVLNPNLELLFQGPQLRPFQFNFKLSARDENEATAIKYIIKYFKRHMAVRKDSTALFLKAPHVFTIQYLKGMELHPSMNLISPEMSGQTKAAALIAFSVNYTPLGTYATYNDTAGTMVSYELSMQFQEIEPLYDEDYTNGVGNNHLIGY